MKRIIFILTFLSFNSAVFAQLDRSKAPEPQPNPEIKIDLPEALVFGNGMQVIMVENHKLPQVSFQLYVDYPVPMEEDKVGLRSVFGEMLGSGTKSTPKDQFDQKIDYIGATFSSSSRGFYASSLKKHTPTLLGLLKEVILEPAFTQEDFDRIISQNMSSLAAIPSDPSTILSNVKSIVNYGKAHPYGEITTEETLSNISLDDVRAFYEKYFIPNHAYLVIVGDVTKEDVKSYFRDYFQDWESKAELESTAYSCPEAKGKNVYFVNKPGAVQSVISVTHNVDLTPGHEDAIKLNVLNQILGGGSFSARLMSNLREDKAYTYGCYSSLSSDPLMGSFSAGGSFRNEVTDSAIVQILNEITRITEEPVLDKELDLAKKSMTGAFARSLESPQTIASFALNMVRYDLPSDYYSSYLKRLERVTKEDLLLVASKYLQPNNLNIIIVGNEEIAEKLHVFDIDEQIDFKNYYGEDEELLKDVPEGMTAEKVIDDYIMGIMMVKNEAELQEKLENVQQIETISKAEIKAYGVTLISYSAQGAPNKSGGLVYMKSAMGSQVAQKEWFDGSQGGSVAGGKTTTYEGEELEDKKKPSFPASQVNYISDPDIHVELLGIATLNKADHYKLKVTEGEEISFEYYAVSNGMIAQRETYIPDPNGEQTSVIIKYSNYEEQSGLFLPKNTEINTQGEIMNFETLSVATSKKAKSKAYKGKFKKIEKSLMDL